MCRVSNPGIWRAFQFSSGLHREGEEGYKQAFLKGHQSTITSLETSPSGRLMVSIESGPNALLILWDMLQGKKVVSFCPHSDSIKTVAFSPDSSMMVTVGTDARRRVQIIVWDVKLLSAKSQEDAIVAKQLSDFSIQKIAFIPFDDLILQNLHSSSAVHPTPATTATAIAAAAFASEPGLVSCGRENIRFWRIRKGVHLIAILLFIFIYSIDILY